MKKLFFLIVLAVVLPVTASAHTGTNYMQDMIDAAVSGDYEAGVEAAESRNQKIDTMGLGYAKIDFDDLYWLSRLVHAEVGADWMPDELQQQVASVVINRVASDYYADTVYDVIFEQVNGVYQYQPACSGAIYNNPNERAVLNALRVLEHGSVFDASVVTQSPWIYGTLHATYIDPVLGSVIYFCEIS